MKRTLAAALMLVAGAAYANTEVSAPAVAAKAAAPTKPELMARGQQIASTVCVACHGLDGTSAVAANPNIGGMPEQYIAKQLAAFKSAERKNPIMQGMVANLTPEDLPERIRNSGQTAQLLTQARQQRIGRGRNVVRAGPKRGGPGCRKAVEGNSLSWGRGSG